MTIFKSSHQFFDFTESLKHINLNLARQGYNGISLNELSNLSDFETTKLLRNFEYQDLNGHPILRNEVSKLHKTNMDNIILRSNIYDLINILRMFENLTEINTPYGLNSVEEIYDFINHTLNEDYYLIDLWGLDIDRIANKNIIIISSIELLLGIEGLNICWGVITNKNLLNKLTDYFKKSGTSCSYIAEIYSIISLRNRNYISSKNQQILEQNLKLVRSLFKSNKLLEGLNPSPIRTHIDIPISNKKSILSNAKNHSLKLIEDESNIRLHYGKSSASHDLGIFKTILESSFNN